MAKARRKYLHEFYHGVNPGCQTIRRPTPTKTRKVKKDLAWDYQCLRTTDFQQWNRDIRAAGGIEQLLIVKNHCKIEASQTRSRRLFRSNGQVRSGKRSRRPSPE